MLATLLVVLVCKSLAAWAIVLAMGYPASTALTAAASLAQVGEFSFILAGLGIQHGLMPFSIPGIDRSALPTFLYMWQPEPLLEKTGGA